MRVRRCPLLCHDKHCHICSGTGYLFENGKPATPEDMLNFLKHGKKPGRRPSPLGYRSEAYKRP